MYIMTEKILRKYLIYSSVKNFTMTWVSAFSLPDSQPIRARAWESWPIRGQYSLAGWSGWAQTPRNFTPAPGLAGKFVFSLKRERETFKADYELGELKDTLTD